MNNCITVYYESLIQTDLAPAAFRAYIYSEEITLENAKNQRIINQNDTNVVFDAEKWFEYHRNGVANKDNPSLQGRKRFDIWNRHIKECNRPEIMENPPKDAQITYLHGRNSFDPWNWQSMNCHQPEIIDNPLKESQSISHLQERNRFDAWNWHITECDQPMSMEELPKETPLTVSDRFSKIAKLKVYPISIRRDGIISTPVCRHKPSDFTMRYKARRVLFPSDLKNDRDLITEFKDQ